MLGYEDTESRAIQTIDSCASVCQQAPIAIDSENLRVGCCAICRQALLAVDRHVFWVIFKSDFEFVSDPNLELFSFLCGLSAYIKKGIVPIDYNLINWFE